MQPRRRQRYPEPTVGAMILNRRGKMLLVKSMKWGDKFTIAGGHVEVGETLVAALKREIMEEVGLEIEDIKLLMVQEAIFSKDFWKPRHFIFFDFVCRARSDRPKVDGKEIQSFEWVSPERALKLGLEKFTRRMVIRFLSKKGAIGPQRSLPPAAPLRRGRGEAQRKPRPRSAGRQLET